MKLLQQEISQLQIEFRTQTKRAKESQKPKVRLLIFCYFLLTYFIFLFSNKMFSKHVIN